MEWLFEFIFELIFEGSIEVSKSNKIPKGVRYLLFAIITLFFIGVIGLIFFVGIISLKQNILAGILLILLGIFMSIMVFINFKKEYSIKKVASDYE